jgi:hypothetical protein
MGRVCGRIHADRGTYQTRVSMILDNQIIVAIIGVIGGIILGIPSMLAVMISINKMNSEKVKNLAEGAEAVANACNKLRTDMEKQVANLERQIEDYKDYRIAIERRIAQVENENVILTRKDERRAEEMELMGRKITQLQRWAERLVEQVRQLGGNPVSFYEIEDTPNKRRITDGQEK